MVLLIGGILCCSAGVGQGGEPAFELRDDVVSVVLSNAGEPAGTISVSYPGRVSGETVAADLAGVVSVSGWQLAPPVLSHGSAETTATATMQPGACAARTYGEPVWPLVWALRRYKRVSAVVMGSRFQAQPGQSENRFVRVRASGGGGLWHYDAELLDASFKTLEELRAVKAVTAKAAAGATDGGAAAQALPGHRVPRPWALIALVAVVVGGLVYVATARLTGRGNPRSRGRR